MLHYDERGGRDGADRSVPAARSADGGRKGLRALVTVKVICPEVVASELKRGERARAGGSREERP